MPTDLAERNELGQLLPGHSLRFALGNAGRPPKYTPDEWETQIATYFAVRNEENRPYTWAGLSLSMGMSREALDNWLKGEYEGRGEKARYVDALKAARTAIEDQREELLIRRESGNIAGIIFALKQYGWRDEKHLNIDQVERHELIVQLPHVLADKLSDAAGERIGTEVALPDPPASG